MPHVRLLKNQLINGKMMKKNRTYPLSDQEIAKLSDDAYVAAEEPSPAVPVSLPFVHSLPIDATREPGVKVYKVDGNTGRTEDITDQAV